MELTRNTIKQNINNFTGVIKKIKQPILKQLLTFNFK